MVWSWGAGTQGQLGLGALEDALEPQQVNGDEFVDLACGGAHVVAILGCGNVTTWGRMQSESLAVPASVPFTSRICQVSAGWNHSAFVSEAGELFTCGDGQFGQLGHGDFNSRAVPCKVSDLPSVLMVACGMRHTLIVTGSGNSRQVKAFGLAKRGQLGTRESKELKTACCPQAVPSLDSCNILTVAAGGDHSAALNGKQLRSAFIRKSSDHFVATGNKLYLWGKGYGASPDIIEPRLANGEVEFCQVSLGWNHGLGLTGNGEVFSWGSNRYGQLGVEENDIAENTDVSMYRVNGLPYKAVCVAAGAEHSASVLANGDLFTWGWGEHGQLGLGHCLDQMLPHRVPLGVCRVCRVYCGSGFTFVK